MREKITDMGQAGVDKLCNLFNLEKFLREQRAAEEGGFT